MSSEIPPISQGGGAVEWIGFGSSRQGICVEAVTGASSLAGLVAIFAGGSSPAGFTARKRMTLQLEVGRSRLRIR